LKKRECPIPFYFNYRTDLASVSLAKTTLLDAGKTGKYFHLSCHFLTGLEPLVELPQGGEGLLAIDNDAAGSGNRDLLAHCIDTAMWLKWWYKRMFLP